MARFRIETVEHIPSGKYFNELYYPDDATHPVAVSPPIYGSFKETEDSAVKLAKKAFPDKPITVQK